MRFQAVESKYSSSLTFMPHASGGMEIYMELLLTVLVSLYDAIAGAIFVTSFTKAEKSSRMSLLISAAAIFVTSPFFPDTASFLHIHPTIIHYVLTLMVLYFLSFTCGRTDVAHKIAAPIIFEAVSLFINSMLYMYFYSNIAGYAKHDIMYTVTAIVLSVAIVKILMTSILLVTTRIVTHEGSHRVLSLMTLSLSPIFTLFTLYLFMKILYYRLNEYNLEVFVAITGTAILNLLTFILFDRTVKAEAENNKLQLYMNKTEMERTRYADMLKLNVELSAVRHDLKNHLILLKKYLNDKDYDGIEKYVDSFEETVENVGTPTLSGNGLLDYIISSKMKSVSDITFVVSGVLSGSFAVEDVDLAVLLGNLIDNSIDAAKKTNRKEKLVELSLSVFNGYQNIIIKNDIESSVIKANSELVTTKSDKKAHGFGLKSVKSIVEKYDGIFEVYEEEGKFCVQIAFPLNKAL